MRWKAMVSPYLSCASLVIVAAVGWQPQAMAQDRQVRVRPGNPDSGYHGMAWDYSGSISLDMVRSNSGSEDGLIRMSSYPKVSGVGYCSPAHRAGIRLGDEIVGVDGRDGRMAPLFGRRVNPPGTVHRFMIRRDDETIEIALTRIERPEKTAEPAGDRGPGECPDAP